MIKLESWRLLSVRMTSEFGASMYKRPSSTLLSKREWGPFGWSIDRRPCTLSIEIGPLLLMCRPLEVSIGLRIYENSLSKLQSNLSNCYSGSLAMLEKREPALNADPSPFYYMTPESATPNFLAIWMFPFYVLMDNWRDSMYDPMRTFPSLVWISHESDLTLLAVTPLFSPLVTNLA